MSVAAGELVAYLDDLLRIREFRDHTSNGLQVEGVPQVERVGFAVDACLQSFEALSDCQMIVVHHGLFWPSIDRVTGPLQRRLGFLLQRGIGLYVSHLPLDRHPQLGNNAQLLKLLGLDPAEEFGEVGWLGEFPRPRPLAEVVRHLEEALGSGVRALGFGPEEVSRLAVCSGGAGLGYLAEAVRLGADAFLSGEASHPVYHAAREAGMNVLLGGHYATETWGVKALMPVLEEAFGVETRFADFPTGF
jgi:dinuclear metal center YbgI/SA1388 family protein